MIKKYNDFINESNFNLEIDLVCQKYNITNYILNDDNSIDVDGSVNLCYDDLTKIPLNFRKVSGWFDCSNNMLTSLEGCPKFTGLFKCNNNKLTSLEGCPEFVGRTFYCNDNKIRTFKGLGQVGKNFICIGNPIKTITNFFNKDLEIHFKFIEMVNTYETLFPRPDLLDGDTLEQIADDLLVKLPIDWKEQLEKVGYQVL